MFLLRVLWVLLWAEILQFHLKFGKVLFVWLLCVYVYSYVPWAILRCVHFVSASSVLICCSWFLALPSFYFVLSCRSPKHKDRLGYPVLWHSCSPQDPSCSTWELWPLEASVGPKWFCGAGSSGSALPQLMWLLVLSVPPCVQEIEMNS